MNLFRKKKSLEASPQMRTIIHLIMVQALAMLVLVALVVLLNMQQLVVFNMALFIFLLHRAHKGVMVVALVVDL